MARLRGRAPRGERLVAAVPHGHWKSLTFIAGLRSDRIEAPWVLDGAMNGEAFRTYLREVLAPTLSEGDTVIMDNLSAHKVKGVREIIEATGGGITVKVGSVAHPMQDDHYIEWIEAVVDGSLRIRQGLAEPE